MDVPVRRYQLSGVSWDRRNSGTCASGSLRRGLFLISFDRRRTMRCSSWIKLILVIFYTISISVHSITAQDSVQNQEALDRDIYSAAFRSINSIRPRIVTGVVYNTSLPASVTDKSVELVQIVRLRSGSLRRYGFRFNEINLPVGVEVLQSLSRVVLVYRRFKSSPYYDATSGNVFVAPVVGILVYDGDDINNYTNYFRPALTVQAGPGFANITVQLQPSRNDNVICTIFNNTDYNITGLGNTNNQTSSGICSWTSLGDYSLLGSPRNKSNHALAIGLGSAFGGVLLILLLLIAIFLCIKYRRRAKFANMVSKSEHGDTLNDIVVGRSRAPSAGGTRTKPVLENDYTS